MGNFCHHRRRLFESSPEPTSNDSQHDTDFESSVSSSPLLYFKEDPELPVYSQGPSSFGLPHLIDILMSGSLSVEKVCKIQLLGVTQNCTFVIDLDCVSIDDLRADDLGSWKPTGTRRSYFKLSETNEVDFFSRVPSEQSSYFVIIRRYFVHLTCPKFRRCIVEIQGEVWFCMCLCVCLCLWVWVRCMEGGAYVSLPCLQCACGLWWFN